MSNLQTKHESDSVLAVCVGDLHWSYRAPLMHDRSNWFKLLQYYAEQLAAVSYQYNAPILCAGDVFDHWDEPAELINHYLKHMPPIWSVAGNHELPNHNYDLIKKSAYWTAVEAGKIHHLDAYDGDPWVIVSSKKTKQLRVFGHSWGQELKTPLPLAPKIEQHALTVAVLHAFIWRADFGHERAKKQDHSQRWTSQLHVAGYDAAIFGDNHKGFSVHNTLGPLKGTVFNCGAFMRRRSDETDYRPSCGILLDTGKIERVYFDTSKDVYNDKKRAVQDVASGFMQEFLEEVLIKNEEDLDFEMIVRRKASRMKNRRLSALILEYLDAAR